MLLGAEDRRIRLAAPAAALAAAVVAFLVAGCGGGGDDGGEAQRPAATGRTSAAHPAPAPAVRSGVRVPQLAGVEIDRARRRATRAGLRMAVSGYVGKYGNGRYNVRCVKVLRQSPVAGERLSKGSAVYVILKECRTPDAAPVPPAGTT